ncbi:ATP-grasp domain-containing protein [Winslowiella toletana]|uniref:ATP-grasp domain-containing protein n=1 Tax=Winslowiella toletana TaxID=92490 RepID=UPI0028BDEDB6|nr:ATP-grasp domain-containing protein [Winslowiella toletana]WNN46388.1 ATP-grasp domain-containing protein [Winslowiella toletana]
MTARIWLMEGLSSQRDIIQGINAFTTRLQADVEVFASHRHQRNEILSQADFALLEPADEQQRLAFIIDTVKKHAIQAIHTGRNTQWFETQRTAIEACGVTLVTGATGADLLALADDKVAFAQLMEKHGLPVVPSIAVTSIAELRQLITASPFSAQPLCIKPVKGIYGMGFWRFDDSVSPMAGFTHPESRKVNTHRYLNALEESGSFEPLVLMPYLPGPEYSVDILAEQGKVLAAVARRKEGALQYLENSGEAFELARHCAQLMGADGLVNVQTRHDSSGKPLLLEINMRPSGGIGYTRFSGVNLSGLFAFRQLGLMSQQAVSDEASRAFSPATVRSVTDVINYSTALPNFIQ